MNRNCYPTEEQLNKIKSWDHRQEEVRDFLDYIESLWWAADWGFHLTGKRVLRLELHTGGWSGNEDIIGALQGTMFWWLFWRKSTRGGHYWFRIEPKLLGRGIK